MAAATPSPHTLPPPVGPMADLLPPEAPSPEAEPTACEVDLAVNVAGAAARAKRDEVKAQAPVLNFIARILGVKTDERSWRVGAKGEEKVGKQLAKLGTEWRVLHSVPIGDRGSDIDHVVIGPAGVFTLNTKRHPGARGWVSEHAILVNGRNDNYLAKSRNEGMRSSRWLSAACGFDVAVQPLIVFVDLDDLTVKAQPVVVHVTYRTELVRWLRTLPTVMDAATIDAVYAKARLSTTWA